MISTNGLPKTGYTSGKTRSFSKPNNASRERFARASYIYITDDSVTVKKIEGNVNSTNPITRSPIDLVTR